MSPLAFPSLSHRFRAACPQLDFIELQYLSTIIIRHQAEVMGVRKWILFDDKGAEALRQYKYVGVDNSLTYK